MSSLGYTKLPSEAIWTKNKNPLKSTDLRGFLVRVVGLKPTSLAVPNRAFYQLNYTRKSKNSISEKTEGKRQDGVNKAWQEEVKAIKKGDSKYDWSKSEIKEILKNGKLSKESGYEGCHILDAKLYPEFADDPNNIIFLQKEIHFKLVHQGNFTNPSNWDEVVKLMPQFADQVADMLKLVS